MSGLCYDLDAMNNMRNNSLAVPLIHACLKVGEENYINNIYIDGIMNKVAGFDHQGRPIGFT